MIFCCHFLTTLLFFTSKTMLHRCFCIVFQCFFSAFLSKIGKNSQIFCNFFSLCINDLRKSYKNNWSKLLTNSENVVSLHCVKH